MKISELITKLTDLKETHGDVEVMILECEFPYYYSSVPAELTEVEVVSDTGTPTMHIELY